MKEPPGGVVHQHIDMYSAYRLRGYEWKSEVVAIVTTMLQANEGTWQFNRLFTGPGLLLHCRQQNTIFYSAITK